MTMVRHYKRKTNRTVGCTEDLRRTARDMIAGGKSIRKTAEALGIPLTTLRDNLKRVGLPM